MNDRKEKFIVSDEYSGYRLDKYLKVHLVAEVSRSYIQILIDEKYVLVNDNSVKSSYKVELNDRITVSYKEELDLDIKPENIPLDIIYQDNDLAIINKPVDMVSHPSAGHHAKTLVNAIMYHIKDLSTINGVTRPGIVHRLDKDTSGLIVVAKNDNAHQELTNQLRDRSMSRTYICLVKGNIETKKGRIKTLIGRDKKNRLKNAVVRENGKEAITDFEVIEYINKYSLVKCHLLTGRTHQIRVHMEFINHPIINDPLYGINNKINFASQQLLHAYRIKFIHPTTKEVMEFTCDLPDTFKKAIEYVKEQ